MNIAILTPKPRPKSVKNQRGQLSLVPLVWLGTTILIAVALNILSGGGL